MKLQDTGGQCMTFCSLLQDIAGQLKKKKEKAGHQHLFKIFPSNIVSPNTVKGIH